ncbi:helix-turn-helix domain-containing protein [Chryseobacterium polytrichastri]|nr:helix-turn-helix transcriptional regulator [Chryseobacterium polytrichastri]
MIKFKLLEVRKRKKLTQEHMANVLYMNISNYSRRENGQIKINTKEWQKLAEILDVPLEQIYETDDEFFIEYLEKKVLNINTLHYCNGQIFYELQKCIEKLELELAKLKEDIKNMKVQDMI